MKQLASTATGIKAVVDLVKAYDVHPSQDGLEFVSPDDLSKWKIESVSMPERLHAFLTDIRLLRRIPISYLVPDPDLLPPESIRFFHVNQTWVDRVIDGVFSNTNIGTVDFHYNLTTLQLVRASVDPAPSGMTGLLIRSELTRRWPKMTVKGFPGVPADLDAPSAITVLRAEAISRDIFIALFAGQPKVVHIREPFEGVRFGVETAANGTWEVDQRTKNGVVLNADQPVAPRNASLRTLDVSGLRTSLAARDAALGNARGVALHLEQRPFVQVFLDSVSEIEGSKEPPPNHLVPLRNGRLFTLQFATQALFHQTP
jgi:hypothetical protein